MLKCQVDKHKKLSQTCSPGKLTKAKTEDNAEQAALVYSLVREVQAIVPIADDILQEQFVRLYIENDPQVHLEVSSVLASRGMTSSPQNIPIIDAMTKLKDNQASIAEQGWEESDM